MVFELEWYKVVVQSSGTKLGLKAWLLRNLAAKARVGEHNVTDLGPGVDVWATSLFMVALKSPVRLNFGSFPRISFRVA